MATEEQRLAALEESLVQQQAASMTLLGIVKDIDKKVDELTGMVRATQIEGTIVETRLSTIDARLSATQHDMTNSFRQLAVYQGQIETRLDDMATKEDVARVEAGMATMKSEILDAFQQLIEIVTKPGQ